MTKTKISLIFLVLITAWGGSFYVYKQKKLESEISYPLPRVFGESLLENFPKTDPFDSSGGTTAPPINLMTVPLLDLEWEEVHKGKNPIKEIKYKNGDLVIKGNGTLQLDFGSVTSMTVARHAIESEHIDTGSINSRAIANGSIGGQDIDENADVIIQNLTVTDTTTFQGGTVVTGDSSINGNLTITGNILPSTNDTYDLGSNTYRWKDLYLGGDTLHIGTSTTDEGTLSYDTTGNILNFGTDATTNADIAFFTDDLYLDKSAGSIGIGTTAPSAGNILHVAGQCVTADTRLRRRRKARKGEEDEADEDGYIYDEVMIKNIKPGDEIASMDQIEGTLVWKQVNGLLNMGIKPIYKLITVTGKSIHTTAEHPYFVRGRQSDNNDTENENVIKQKLFRFEVDQSIRIEEYTKDTIIAIANSEQSYAVIIPKKIKQALRDALRSKENQKHFEPAIFASAIAAGISRAKINVHELVIDIEYPEHEDIIIQVIRAAFPHISIHFAQVGKKSPAHYAAYGVYKKQKTANDILAMEDLSKNAENALPTVTHPHIRRTIRSRTQASLTDANIINYEKKVKYQKHLARTGYWTVVSDIAAGEDIAVVYGDKIVWERIAKINKLPSERVYDIEIDGTHNFVANDIVAHNTYISGNVGIGTTSPTAVLHLKAGTATANTAPLKLTSGTINTTPEAGAIEFLTDAYYGTITTGAVRKTFAFLESPSFTTPTLGVATATSLAIGANTLDTTEWANLDGLNQTLATTSSPTFVGLTVSGLTASQLLATDGSKNLVSLAVATYPSLTELTYVKGVTSALQTQLDAKQPLDAQLTDIAGLAVTDNNFIVGNGTNFVAESGATARTSLGLGTISTEAEANYALLAGRSGGQILTGGTGTTDDLTLQTTSGIGAAGADMHFLVGNNGATEAMTILNSGNVGIGTTDPGKRLEIKDTIQSNLIGSAGGMRIYDLIGVGQRIGINFKSYSGQLYGDAEIGSVKESDTGDERSGLYFATKVGTAGDDRPLERMRIDMSGNVGIGTTSPTAVLHLKAGTATANTAPLKFTSGALNTAAEAGAVEFLTDDAYLTITTGATRKGLVLTDGSNLVSGRVPYATTNGRLIDSANMTFDGTTLTVAGMSSTGNLNPSADNTYDLGTSALRWQDLHLGPASLNIYSTTGTGGATANYTLGNVGFSGGALQMVTTNAGTAVGGQINLTSAYPSGNTITSAFNIVTSTDLGVADEVLQIGDSAGTFMTVLGNGNVGIGTTGPSVDAQLDVVSTGASSIRIKGNTSGSSVFSAALVTAESNIDQRARGLFLPTTDADANNSWFAGVPYNSGGFQIGNSTVHEANDSNGPYISSNAKLFITTAGNVGIGTTGPTANLQVAQGTAGVGTVSNGAGGTTVTGVGTQFLNTFKVGDTITIVGQTVAISAIASDTSMTTAAITNANSAVAYTLVGGTRFSVLGNGNVGIGTTGPTHILQVQEPDDFTKAMFVNNPVANSNSWIYLGQGTSAGRSGALGFQDNSDTTSGYIWLLNYGDSNPNGLAIKKGGNVGIGTTSPSSALSVEKLDTTNAVLYVRNTGGSGNSPSAIFRGGANNTVNHFQIQDYDGNADFVVQGTGNVGIGTTSPLTKLHVSATGSGVINAISLTNPNGATAGNGTAIAFGANSDASNATGQIASVLTASSGSNSYMTFSTRLSDVLAEKMRIDNNGNVGIGTTDPAAKLQVWGAAGSLGVLNVNADSGSGTIFSVTGDNPATASPLLYVLRSGNVGIGTTSPGAKLNVVADTASDYATEIFNDGNAATRWGLLVQSGLDDQTAAGPSTLVQFNDGDGGAVGSITFGSSVTNYNTSSDARLKQNISNTALGISELMRIQVRDYTWRADDSNRIAHGFIAQELYNVYPDAVTVPQDDRYWMVDYSKLTPLIVQSIQDQQGEIAAQGEQLVSVSLQTTQNITTVSELQASVDDELLVISGSINTLNDSLITQEEALKALKKVLAEQSDRIAFLEHNDSDANWQGSFDALSSRSDLLESGIFSLTSNVSLLTSQVETLTEFYTTLGLGNFLSKDSEGNIDLGKGIFTAKEIKADEGHFKKITIESGGEESTVTGKGEIKEGETIVIIETVAAEKDINIMVTPRATFDGSLAVTNVETGKSFTVEIRTPADTDIPFTWWIVGQENAQ